MAKFCQIPDLCQKVQPAQISNSATPVKFPTAVTHKAPTIGHHITNHRKAGRVACRNGIQSFWSLGQSKAQKFSSVLPLFCLEREFSSEVNLQNSVTSKQFVG
jgi:hypothetical protein